MTLIKHLVTITWIAIVLFASAAPLHARKVVLVIGNASYTVSPLANPISDAAAIAHKFKELNFDLVDLRRNLTATEMRSALREFSREAAGADIAVVYYAGHGIEVAGKNYLVPIDAALQKAADIDLETIELQTILRQIEGARKLKLVLLDACRNNIFPLSGSKRSLARGLAPIEPEDNTLIAYAAAAGTTADDGKAQHSPFTEALLKHLSNPGTDIRQVLGKIRDEVIESTNRGQIPHIYGSLGGNSVALIPHGQASDKAPQSSSRDSVSALESKDDSCLNVWQTIKETTSIAILTAFAESFPGCPLAVIARARATELKNTSAPTPAERHNNYGRELSVFDVTRWIEQTYLKDSALYADSVLWYARGYIARESVALEKRAYAARWPIRQFVLRRDTITVARVDAGTYKITFDLDYFVRSNVRNQEKRGRTTTVLEISARREGIYILTQNEKVH